MAASKTIKVTEPVYLELDKIREKRETFSDVVNRLLEARPHILRAYDLIAGAAEYGRRQQEDRP